MASERPRRSTRVPEKYQEKTAVEKPIPSSSTPKKRKAPVTKDSHDDPTTLDFLLANAKSPLINLELSTLINEHTWTAFSQDSRALLSTMLPPTVFPFFRPNIDAHHPANRQTVHEEVDPNTMDVDSMALASEPDLSFLTDPFFEADAKAFQDHLYSGWLTPAHGALVQEYTENLKRGEIHAAWKDDMWAGEHPATNKDISVVDGLAGDASSLTLRDLAKNSIVRVGDVLAYSRYFSQFNLTVAKDVLIDSIQPSTHSLTVLVSPSTQRHLPPAHLKHLEMAETASEQDTGPLVQSMTITNPSQLEGALLDTDASIERAKRPNGNAWKSFGVWRWRDGGIPHPSAYPEASEEASRGGREYHGTLFYLRGCFYDDQ